MHSSVALDIVRNEARGAHGRAERLGFHVTALQRCCRRLAALRRRLCCAAA
jgi:hypothetical protein